MHKPFFDEHRLDFANPEKPVPAGGVSFGAGFTISWQNGPLGVGPARVSPNGAFVETILQAVERRIKFYEESGFGCPENRTAIEHINLALKSLNDRTRRREVAGVEGSHDMAKGDDDAQEGAPGADALVAPGMGG